MCFDTCTINIRVSIRVRGLHLVFSPRKLRNNGRPFFGKWCTKVQIFCEFQWTNIACQLNIKSSHWSPRSKSQAHPIEVVRIQFWGSSSCLKAILLGGWALPLWKMMEWVRQLGFDEIPIFFNGKSFNSMVPVTTSTICSDSWSFYCPSAASMCNGRFPKVGDSKIIQHWVMINGTSNGFGYPAW